MSGRDVRPPAGQQSVRGHNLSLVLGAIADDPDGLSRAQLAATTGLTRATTGALVDELIASRLVIERAPQRGGRGRPGSPLSLNPAGPSALGIEINVDYVSACVLDLTGAVRAIDVVRRDNRSRPPADALEDAVALGRQVVAQSGLDPAGIGLALPGLVDDNAVLRRAPNLDQWRDVAPTRALGAGLGESLPIRVENEANLAALAQLWYGRPTGLRDFVHVSGEIGIGAGVVLRGELFRGVNGWAGEVGHVIVAPGGPSCHCGSRGCLEQLAGQDALLRDSGCADVDQLLARATAGDDRAGSVLAGAGSALGIALVSTINVLDVPCVVLGGIYSTLAPWLLEPLSRELARTVAGAWAQPRVVASSLGDDAAVRGAAGTVVHEIVERAGRAATTTLIS